MTIAQSLLTYLLGMSAAQQVNLLWVLQEQGLSLNKDKQYCTRNHSEEPKRETFSEESITFMDLLYG